MRELVIIDAHLHLYPQLNVDRWLESAFARLGHYEDTAKCAVLAITETDNEGAWQRLVEQPEHHFAVEDVRQNSAWIQSNSLSLLLIRGRQYNSAERIEVLALNADFAALESVLLDQLSLKELTARVHAHGGIAVVPWGFGKWVGKRGALVREWIDDEAAGLIGDSGGRPSWLDGSIIRAWRQGGRIDCVGSDPLNIAGHERNVLRCVLQARIAAEVFEAEDIATALLNEIATQPAVAVDANVTAKRPGMIRFLIDQVALRLNKK